jgi:hypothetical protein
MEGARRKSGRSFVIINSKHLGSSGVLLHKYLVQLENNLKLGKAVRQPRIFATGGGEMTSRKNGVYFVLAKADLVAPPLAPSIVFANSHLPTR